MLWRKITGKGTIILTVKYRASTVIYSAGYSTGCSASTGLGSSEWRDDCSGYTG